LSTLLNQRSKR